MASATETRLAGGSAQETWDVVPVPYAECHSIAGETSLRTEFPLDLVHRAAAELLDASLLRGAGP